MVCQGAMPCQLVALDPSSSTQRREALRLPHHSRHQRDPAATEIEVGDGVPRAENFRASLMMVASRTGHQHASLVLSSEPYHLSETVRVQIRRILLGSTTARGRGEPLLPGWLPCGRAHSLKSVVASDTPLSSRSHYFCTG
jgi:hypothetical protein